MPNDVAAKPKRLATNVTLPEPSVQEGRALSVNISQACERDLAASVRKAKADQWLQENRAAIDAWNEWVEVNEESLFFFAKKKQTTFIP